MKFSLSTSLMIPPLDFMLLSVSELCCAAFPSLMPIIATPKDGSEESISSMTNPSGKLMVTLWIERSSTRGSLDVGCADDEDARNSSASCLR